MIDQLDILPFHRISAPQVIEGEANISLKPQGKFLVEVRRTDGTIRRPFGDNWVGNQFLNQFKNQVLTWGGLGSLGWGQNNSGFASLFYPNANYTTYTTWLQVGTSNTAVNPTQTTLTGTKTANSWESGNTITISPTTGDIVFVVKQGFSPEGSPVTYNEAGITTNGSANGYYTPIGTSSYSEVKLNSRCVFPSGVSLLTGERLVLTYAITVPTLTANSQTITLTADNGMNVSGQLKLVGNLPYTVGGTVSSLGVRTNTNTNSSGILPVSPQISSGLFGLTGATSFPAFGSNTTGMNTNTAGTSAWAAYTSGSFYRDYIGIWNSGTGPFTFRSITLSGGGVNGYQLLLDNEMTKTPLSTLQFGLRFSMA